LFMHAATPPSIVARLREATIAATASPELRSRLEPVGITLPPPEHQTSEYLADLLRSEIVKWAGPVKAAGVRIE
jgi:tripartite-type tricarboxylate transporter receptor subunit TctC